MTKDQAKILGYCNHCAAFYTNVAHCGPGITDVKEKCLCLLPSSVVARWKKDYGIEHDKSWTHVRVSKKKEVK